MHGVPKKNRTELQINISLRLLLIIEFCKCQCVFVSAIFQVITVPNFKYVDSIINQP